MSVILRILLFAASVLTAAFIARKLQKCQMQVHDAVYWILFSLLLVCMSLFPDAVVMLANLAGVLSPVNFVFLVMIFLLFLRCFLLSVRLSELDEKLRNLVEEIAVRDNMKHSAMETQEKGHLQAGNGQG